MSIQVGLGPRWCTRRLRVCFSNRVQAALGTAQPLVGTLIIGVQMVCRFVDVPQISTKCFYRYFILARTGGNGVVLRWVASCREWEQGLIGMCSFRPYSHS
jgi:hypothetical protein